MIRKPLELKGHLKRADLTLGQRCSDGDAELLWGYVLIHIQTLSLSERTTGGTQRKTNRINVRVAGLSPGLDSTIRTIAGEKVAVKGLLLVTVPVGST